MRFMAVVPSGGTLNAMASPRDPIRSEIVEVLVAAGDHACACGDHRALSSVARKLRVDAPLPLQHELTAIENGVENATQHWSSVSRCIHDWIASTYAYRG